MEGEIVLGSDFAGFELKEKIKKYLIRCGYQVSDLGMTDPDKPMPYHEVGYKIGKVVHEGRYRRGILICGSGMGIHISAGKWSGVYCALCESVETAKRSRIANNCNILAFGAFYVSEATAYEMVNVFLHTDFGEGMDADFTQKHRQWLDEMEHFEYQ